MASESVATERADTAINRKEVLSYALMVLLERLGVKQREVFILKEAFDYGHAEIGEVLNITEEYSRQLLARAKKQLEINNTVKKETAVTEYLHKYLDVIRKGDMQHLEQFLSEDITVVSDGGGKAVAGMNPVSESHSCRRVCSAADLCVGMEGSSLLFS